MCTYLQAQENCNDHKYTHTFKHAHAQSLHSLEDCYAHSARGPVHISSNAISGTVGDEDFGVTIDKALQLNRHTEYCQWMQHTHDQCDTCSKTSTDSKGKKMTTSKKCNCRRTYTYVKTWRNHRINSLLFDQPAAHHNPQRDPFPAAAFFSSDARVGEVDLDVQVLKNKHSSLRGTTRNVNWTPAAQREVQWYDGAWRWLETYVLPETVSNWFVDTTRYEYLQNLKHARSSRAGTDSNFVYVGQNRGYFFSPYAPSAHEFLFKMFVEHLEGSLLDWQIGDLMPSCTAGDIRVSYRTKDPDRLSAIGRLVDGRERARLTLFTTSRNYQLGLAHEGIHEFGDMFETEAVDAKWSCLLLRALMIIWAIVPSHLVAAFFAKELTTTSEVCTSCIGIVGTILPVAWATIWKQDFLGSSQDIAMVLLLLAAVPIYVRTLYYAHLSATPGGFTGMWRWVAAAICLDPAWYGSAAISSTSDAKKEE
mmetsp:Transcript_71577/g.116032  ORF Transcript_71577/g.116032 Transcript_71577/m.116032 type:complete len:478 (+) Transcript_71577:196-1629(+)